MPKNRSSWLIALADPMSIRARDDDFLLSLSPDRQHLATGIAQLLRGDTARSRRTFGDEYRAAEEARDGERAMLALSLGWLAEVRHFNMFPGGCGGGSVELELAGVARVVDARVCDQCPGARGSDRARAGGARHVRRQLNTIAS